LICRKRLLLKTEPAFSFLRIVVGMADVSVVPRQQWHVRFEPGAPAASFETLGRRCGKTCCHLSRGKVAYAVVLLLLPARHARRRRVIFSHHWQQPVVLGLLVLVMRALRPA